ncbi:MAG: DUF2220 family protein [Bermanella sp.]
MDAEALIKQLIRDALAADNARNGRSVQLKPGLKKYSKQVKSLGNFADEALYEELQSLQASTPWLNHLKPDAIEVVEGVKSIRFTIDLACHEALAQYADYTPDAASLYKQEWLSLVASEHPHFKSFSFLRWGDCPQQAWQHIHTLKKLLTGGRFSQQQLSAILFNDAKRLTKKDIHDLILVYPNLKNNIRPRKVILNYYAQDTPKKCLIVENMDTYHYLQGLIPSDWMLVCGFGYRVTKADITDLKIVDLHAHRLVSDQVKQACETFWQDTLSIKLYWGDLDDEGQQIFASLKQQYPSLKKWPAAYAAMEQRRQRITAGSLDVHQEAILCDALTFT